MRNDVLLSVITQQGVQDVLPMRGDTHRGVLFFKGHEAGRGTPT